MVHARVRKRNGKQTAFPKESRTLNEDGLRNEARGEVARPSSGMSRRDNAARSLRRPKIADSGWAYGSGIESSPAGDRPRGVVCEKCSVIKKKANEWYVDARQR